MVKSDCDIAKPIQWRQVVRSTMKRMSPRKQLSDEVASYLREAIVAGEIAPGSSVRAEAVGELLSVSATPVREALHTLKVEGFLELIPRKGFIVASLHAKDIRDIFEAHALIAGELTARATANMSAEQLRSLQQIHEKVLAAADKQDHELLEKENHDFHRTIYFLADSERLRWALGSFLRYVPRAFYSQIQGWPETTSRDHTEIIEAIKDGDSEVARHAMAQHIRNSGEKLAEYIEKRHAEANQKHESVTEG